MYSCQGRARTASVSVPDAARNPPGGDTRRLIAHAENTNESAFSTKAAL